MKRRSKNAVHDVFVFEYFQVFVLHFYWLRPMWRKRKRSCHWIIEKHAELLDSDHKHNKINISMEMRALKYMH